MAFATAAAALPSLLAYNLAPSPTLLNQALALALWGAFVAASLPARPGRGSLPLMAALGLVGLAALASWLGGNLPSTLALSALGLLVAAGVMTLGAAGARVRSDATDLFAAFCWGWLIAGCLNVGVAAVQVLMPDMPDGNWIAASGLPGRAVGNLRQPNHLSSLLLWSCIAVVALVQMRRLAVTAGALVLAALVAAVVTSASRTGLLSVLLLAVWGALDRRMCRPARALLLATPLIYALAWFGMAQWAAATAHSFGGEQRLAETDISGSRFGIWLNTLALIRSHPWFGVGFGEFNLAWSMTPFPGRPTAFFDHTHNLPLQLVVELGLPLGLLVTALLGWALWRAARQAWSTPGDAGTAQGCAVMMVLMISLHSLLEYPLWYAYFLLPAAWAWGFALARAPAASAAPASPAGPFSNALAWSGLALVLGAAFVVLDYSHVVAVFRGGPEDAPLPQRVAQGQRSVFFGHHADYAAVTSGLPVKDPEHAFDRATHYLLDTRLMMAWARSLADRGQVQAARHVAARLREFRKDDAEEFFAPCAPGASAPTVVASEPAPAAVPASAPAQGQGLPFQCQDPDSPLPWRALLDHPAGPR